MELNVLGNPEDEKHGGRFSVQRTGCSPSSKCGNGMEKIYPTCAVRYGYMGYIGEFRYSPGQVFACGGKVVVQTNRGMELGEQVSLTCTGCDKSISREDVVGYAKRSGPEFYQFKAGKILRAATPQDIAEAEHLNQDAARKLLHARDVARTLELNMKFVTCEHLLGGERVIFHFMSDDRIDFRELVRELAKEYHTRIEMHQVGARDEARLVADYEICGRECCCKNFLKKLRQVNMKMAKLQKATLDPSKVSGRCGRLRCCLRYEHEGYEELNKKLPRNGARIRTARGVGTVKDRQILTQLLMVIYDDNNEMETIGVEEVLEKGLPKRSMEEIQAEQDRRNRPAERSRPPRRGDRSSQPEQEEKSDGPSRRRRPRREEDDRPAEDGRNDASGDSTESQSPDTDAPSGSAPGSEDGGEGSQRPRGRRRGKRGRGRRGRGNRGGNDGAGGDAGQNDSGL
ncbi:MAG: hypothetical protein H6819_11725 [Phycisphaerales bacterium]|nr:hypothetical protein [Phycisphaerales bacterium]MCB9854066.1 hypothetical protein [Phycisphaerales bacterium]